MQDDESLHGSLVFVNETAQYVATISLQRSHCSSLFDKLFAESVSELTFPDESCGGPDFPFELAVPSCGFAITPDFTYQFYSASFFAMIEDALTIALQSSPSLTCCSTYGTSRLMGRVSTGLARRWL